MKQEVLGLDVAMDDAEAVAVGDGVDDGFGGFAGVELGELVILNDLIKQLAAQQQLHNQTHVPLILKNIDKLHDVGMVH